MELYAIFQCGDARVTVFEERGMLVECRFTINGRPDWFVAFDDDGYDEFWAAPETKKALAAANAYREAAFGIRA